MHLIILGLVSVDLEQQLAISSDRDINAQDSLGRTPLHWAAARGDAVATGSLLNAHASTTTRDSRNQMPIRHCAMIGMQSV
jgi:ankyrin repeat protein